MTNTDKLTRANEQQHNAGVLLKVLSEKIGTLAEVTAKEITDASTQDLSLAYWELKRNIEQLEILTIESIRKIETVETIINELEVID